MTKGRRMQVALEPWGPDDLGVLRRANTAELTRFLGGPESDAALAARHAEYLGSGAAVQMFRIEVDGQTAGYAGWWEQEHEGRPAYEIGCVVESAWQGRGVASIAVSEIVGRAIAAGDGRPLVGYADAANEASHALCRRVGFELEGTGLFPSDEGGTPVTVNVWVIRPSTPRIRPPGAPERAPGR